MNPTNNQPNNHTITQLIDSIDFTKPKAKTKQFISETSSISGSHSSENKEVAKGWTKEEIVLFKELLETNGTDFTLMKTYFPKKSKNQLKNKYKQLLDEPNFYKMEENN